jgi:flagellar biogenesis protein FliO
MPDSIEYLKLAGVLALVVGMAFVALRFWLPKLTGIRAAKSGPMRIAWSLVLEPRKTLYIVRAGSDYVLVAASEAGVQFLASLDAGRMEAELQVPDERVK